MKTFDTTAHWEWFLNGNTVEECTFCTQFLHGIIYNDYQHFPS